MLTDSLNLREFEGNSVKEIRCTHNELVACYAVKEERLCLFESRDEKDDYRATADKCFRRVEHGKEESRTPEILEA